MPRLLLSKATLSKQRQQLKAYQRFLPSLEMKRQQLMLAQRELRDAREVLQQQQQQRDQWVRQQMTMLAIEEIDLDGLVEIEQLQIEPKNLVGVWLQQLEQLQFKSADIALMARPHWVAPLQQQLMQGIRGRLELQLAEANLQAVAEALRKVTQRVNLFDKVLIPETEANIRKIRIYLDDKQREAVVTSKIAKNKRLKAAQEAEQ